MRNSLQDEPRLKLDISGAFARRVTFDGANLAFANLSGADLANASFRGANFYRAKMDGTNLRGADLRDAKNLTAEQIDRAIIDNDTRLPDNLANLEPNH